MITPKNLIARITGTYISIIAITNSLHARTGQWVARISCAGVVVIAISGRILAAKLLHTGVSSTQIVVITGDDSVLASEIFIA